MKIAPVSPLSQPSNSTEAVSSRLIKMNTNATPETLVHPQSQGELPISDANEEKKSETVVEQSQPLSPQLAALAKQKRALQVKERELEQQRRELEAKLQGSDQVPLSKLKSQPLQVLLEAGITYEDLTQAILQNQTSPEVASLKSEIDNLKQGFEKRFSEQEEAQIRAALSEKRFEAERLLSSPDYEAVRETGSLNKVIQLIERTYRESGEVLPVPEALSLVENALRNRFQKASKLSFLQSQQNPAEGLPQQSPKPGMRTLTNKDTASVPMNRKQRALAAFYGTLKG